MERLVLNNAKLVTPDDHFLGAVVVENGIITAVEKDTIYTDQAVDLNGQWLIPGIIDIHSDYFEKELHPRKSAEFPVPFAMHYMDARAINCGITTLFSAISYTQSEGKEDRSRTFQKAIELTRSIADLKDNLLASHFIHARIDPNSDAVLDVLDQLKVLPNLKLVVYNDSIPGQRQFPLSRSIQTRAEAMGVSLEEATQLVMEQVKQKSKINHKGIIAQSVAKDTIIGSHDDTTIEHVNEAFANRAILSEMPTTIEAARRAKELGMWVCMGAPNYYRGGSHCGNLACHQAIQENVVDMLCSDYHFPALIGSLIKMLNDGIDPSFAVNLMTLNPAKMLGLDHLGSIEVGKQADLVSFVKKDGYAAVQLVVKEGKVIHQSHYDSRQVSNAVSVDH